MGGPYNEKFFMNKKKMNVYNEEVVRKADGACPDASSAHFTP